MATRYHPNPDEQCQVSVYHNDSTLGSRYACENRSKYVEDGKRVCGTHSKAAKERRDARTKAHWAADDARNQAKWDTEREQRRRAECFPDLLAALEALAGPTDGLFWDKDGVRCVYCGAHAEGERRMDDDGHEPGCLLVSAREAIKQAKA